MKRWLKRIALGLVALIALAVAVVVIVLHTGWGRGVVKDQLEDALAESFPGGVHIGAIELGVFGEIVVRDLRIDQHDHRPELVVGQARIDVDRLPLLGKTVHIERLVLDDVTVTIPPPAPAKPEQPAGPRGEPSPWQIELDDLEIHRAHVIRDRIEVTDLEVAGTLRMSGGAITAVVAASAKVADQTVTALGTVHYVGDTIDVPLVRVAAGGARANVIGGRIVDGVVHEGAVLAVVPAEAAHTLAAVEIPGDASAVATIHDGALAVDATLGVRSARVMGTLDVARPAVRGLAIVNDPRGIAIAAVHVSPAGIEGIVSGYFDDLRGAVAVDGSSLKSGGLVVAGVRGDRMHGGVFAEVVRRGDAWQVTRSHVVGTVHGLGKMRGQLDASLAATGRVWPEPDLRVDGTLDGDRAGWGNLSAAHVHVALADVRGPEHPRGSVHLEVTGATSGTTPLGSVRLDAHGSGERDGTAAIAIDGGSIQTAAGATWAVSGAKVAIDPERIAVTGLHAANGGSALDLEAKLQVASGDLGAKLTLTDIALATVAPGATGTVAGQLAVSRKRGAWSATGGVHARGLTVSGQTLDGDGDVALAGRRLTVHAGVHGAALGGGTAKVVLDVDGPRDPTDAAGWLALDRRALREASVELDRVAVAGLGLDGKVAVAASSAGGAVRFTGVRLRGGEVAGQVAIEHTANADLQLIATAHDGPARAAGIADLALPARIFDPDAWRRLGRGALRSATISVPELAFDPGVLAKLGVVAPYRGKLAATIDIAPGATGAKASAHVTGLAGGILIRPVDLAVDGALDDSGLSASVTASSGKVVLAQGEMHSPFTFGYGDLRHAPMTGKVTLPDTPAKDLLALFGRTDITAGHLGGTIELAGTFGTPTGRAQIAAHDIAVAQGLAQRKPVVLVAATVDARWGGASGTLELTGDEASGGSLRVSASGRPDVASTIDIEVVARKFDLAPLAALAPGPLVAAAGLLDASLAVRGLDPQTGDLRGELHLTGGRLPLSPTIGTIRQAKLDLTIAGHTASAVLTAKLGKGDLKGTGKLSMTGGRPTNAELDLKLAGVSPVGAIEPVITAEVAGRLAYSDRWTGLLKVSHGTIKIPSTERDAILDAGAPSDMLFVDAPPPIPKGVHRAPPSHPWLVATVDIAPTQIEVENFRDAVSGRVDLDGQLVVSVGDGVGYDGSLSCRRGDIDILGRSYQIDHASFAFDGSLDPLLDIRIVHDFSEVSLTADVHGRSSAPDLALSSDPGIYSDSQLLGFFMGGEPGGDPSSASRDAAAGAGASVLSTKAGSVLKKYLPIGLDVLDYDPGTSTSSSSIRAGKWLTRKLKVQYRGHPEARPDENSNEGDLEYYLPKNWFLQGVVGDHDVDGLDLLHRWRW